MNIYITGTLPKTSTQNARTVKLQMPALPTVIKCTSAAKMTTYEILDKGPVSLPNGNEISEYSWEGFLPGESRKNDPWLSGPWISPQTIANYFEIWKQNGERLQLNITGTPINTYVYLKDYQMSFSGAFGDYSYSVTFINALSITVTSTKIQKTSTKTQAPAKTAPKRATTTKKQRTYTVRKGDCLWSIARKYYGKGSQWKKIYNANKSSIEKTAKKRGKKSSQNGHWIFAGQKLVIP